MTRWIPRGLLLLLLIIASLQAIEADATPGEFYQKALDYLKEGRLEEALEQLDNLVKNFPQSYEVLQARYLKCLILIGQEDALFMLTKLYYEIAPHVPLQNQRDLMNLAGKYQERFMTTGYRLAQAGEDLFKSDLNIPVLIKLTLSRKGIDWSSLKAGLLVPERKLKSPPPLEEQESMERNLERMAILARLKEILGVVNEELSSSFILLEGEVNKTIFYYLLGSILRTGVRLTEEGRKRDFILNQAKRALERVMDLTKKDPAGELYQRAKRLLEELSPRLYEPEMGEKSPWGYIGEVKG